MLSHIPFFRAVLLVVVMIATRLSMPAQSTATLLRLIDSELGERERHVEELRMTVDSLRRLLYSSPADYGLMEKLGRTYAHIDNDSAIAVYSRAYNTALSCGDRMMADRFLLLRLPHLPLSGFLIKARDDFESIDTVDLDHSLIPLYYESASMMYDAIAEFHSSFPDIYAVYDRLGNEAQRMLVDWLDPTTPYYKYQAAEAFMNSGELSLATTILSELTDSLPDTDPVFTKATYLQSLIAGLESDQDYSLNRLARSALSSLRSGSPDAPALYELGIRLFQAGDTHRAGDYLAVANGDALASKSQPRLMMAARNMPIIEQIQCDRLKSSYRQQIVLAIALLFVLLAFGAILWLYIRQRRRIEELKRNASDHTHTRDTCIRELLALCSGYMDKLNDFCRIVSRKINTGKVDELLQLTQTGKFVEVQTRDYYTIFDNAFLNLCPDFVDGVNALLRPEHQIVLRDTHTLTPDLRILAFLRMGVDDSNRIATLLNYSVNTIYTYRNKMKNWALDRETFEDSVRHL